MLDGADRRIRDRFRFAWIRVSAYKLLIRYVCVSIYVTVMMCRAYARAV